MGALGCQSHTGKKPTRFTKKCKITKRQFIHKNEETIDTKDEGNFKCLNYKKLIP